MISASFSVRENSSCSMVRASGFFRRCTKFLTYLLKIFRTSSLKTKITTNFLKYSSKCCRENDCGVVTCLSRSFLMFDFVFKLLQFCLLLVVRMVTVIVTVLACVCVHACLLACSSSLYRYSIVVWCANLCQGSKPVFAGTVRQTKCFPKPGISGVQRAAE